jgi:hypothetical protein
LQHALDKLIKKMESIPTLSTIEKGIDVVEKGINAVVGLEEPNRRKSFRNTCILITVVIVLAISQAWYILVREVFKSDVATTNIVRIIDSFGNATDGHPITQCTISSEK